MGPSAAAANTGATNHEAKHRSNNNALHRQLADFINTSLKRMSDGAKGKIAENSVYF
jgi:hypothetical protein